MALTINNGDSCAVVNNIDFSVSSLYAYSSSTFASPKNKFKASDIAYFGAVIQSTNATLTSFSVSSVCMQFNTQTCTPIIWSNLSPAAGFNPTFSVNMAQTRAFTQDTGIQGFVIKATIDVTWAEDSGTKRDALQNARVNLNSVVAVSDAEDEEAANSANMPSVSSFVVGMMLILSAML